MNADLIDRYVHAVTRRLPRSQRQDVDRELRSSVLDELEDRFGSQPKEEDVVAVLQQMGPPEEVASSYRPSNDYLIGPGWFPAFKHVLRIVISCQVALLVAAVAYIVFIGAGPLDRGAALFEVFGMGVKSVLYATGLILVLFTVLERVEIPSPRKHREWNPRRLPPFSPDDGVLRFEAATTIAVTAFFLALLYVLRDNLGIPATDGLLLVDVFKAGLPWLSAAFVLEMALYSFLLWQGNWSRVTRILSAAIDLFGLAVIWGMSRGVLAGRDVMTAAGLSETGINVIEALAYGIPAFIALVLIAEHGRVFLRSQRRRKERSTTSALSQAPQS